MKMEPAFNSRRIAVNGVTLNVIVEGKGADVLLVHGFPDCHDVYGATRSPRWSRPATA